MLRPKFEASLCFLIRAFSLIFRTTRPPLTFSNGIGDLQGIGNYSESQASFQENSFTFRIYSFNLLVLDKSVVSQDVSILPDLSREVVVTGLHFVTNLLLRSHKLIQTWSRFDLITGY